MTREEEIEKASNKYIESYLKSSNEYPLCDNRKRMSLIQVDLYKMQKAFEKGMKEADKTMLDRACKWLAEHISPEEIYEYANETPTIYLTVNLYDNMLDFINDFEQAMKGGADERLSV